MRLTANLTPLVSDGVLPNAQATSPDDFWSRVLGLARLKLYVFVKPMFLVATPMEPIPLEVHPFLEAKLNESRVAVVPPWKMNRDLSVVPIPLYWVATTPPVFVAWVPRTASTMIGVAKLPTVSMVGQMVQRGARLKLSELPNPLAVALTLAVMLNALVRRLLAMATVLLMS